MGGVLLRDCTLLFLGSFLLCAAQVRGQDLPLAACLIAALPLGLRSLSAACGAVVGYFVFCEGTSCVELLALSVLMLAAVTVFQGTTLAAKDWFMPAMTASVCAVLKGIEVLSGGIGFGSWVLHWVAGGLFCGVFRSAVAMDRQAQLISAAMLICGLSMLPVPVNLGLLCAVALCVATGKLKLSIVFGIAMDLGGGIGGTTAALVLPALLGQRLYPRAKSLYALFYLVIPNVIFLLLDSASAGNGIAVASGTALGLLLGKLRAFSYRSEGDAGENGGAKLAMAAEVLELLRRQLPRATAPACIGEAESVFDGAAERVCRCCERFHRCWQHRAVETYEALSSAARPMIERGVAQSEDLPPAFRDRCCHLEGFVTAINQELEGMLFRRRYRMQLEESRQVVSQQLECLAEYLQATREERLPLHKKRAAYLPRVGICTIGKNGSPINGDQGACFAGMDTDYYVLLCDGMGTGSWAQRMCTETVNLLERLLRSGLAPQSALKLLNGMELLRGDDRFTTVDLLHLNLSSGDAVLYKWGSAPSYWRRDEETKKIGTASPPPGVGVGGEHAPERYELSLKEGELLVLTSDGAGEEELETAISMYSGTSPQELAALLISGKTAQDDMSAVVISLQPYAS